MLYSALSTPAWARCGGGRRDWAQGHGVPRARAIAAPVLRALCSHAAVAVTWRVCRGSQRRGFVWLVVGDGRQRGGGGAGPGRQQRPAVSADDPGDVADAVQALMLPPLLLLGSPVLIGDPLFEAGRGVPRGAGGRRREEWAAVVVAVTSQRRVRRQQRSPLRAGLDGRELGLPDSTRSCRRWQQLTHVQRHLSPLVLSPALASLAAPGALAACPRANQIRARCAWERSSVGVLTISTSRASTLLLLMCTLAARHGGFALPCVPVTPAQCRLSSIFRSTTRTASSKSSSPRQAA